MRRRQDDARGDARDDAQAGMAQRWMLSWSDFLTLLLVVFAAMYANARMVPALPMPDAVAVTQGGDSPADGTTNEVARLAADLQARLTMAYGGKVRAQVLSTARGVLLELDAPLLFASGDAQLSSEAIPLLGALVSALDANAYPVIIEGYSDSMPIHNRQFPSNWELSSARAASVARFLADKGLAERRLQVVGRSANFPLSDEQTPEARRQNRRVSILIEVTHHSAASKA